MTSRPAARRGSSLTAAPLLRSGIASGRSPISPQRNNTSGNVLQFLHDRFSKQSRNQEVRGAVPGVYRLPQYIFCRSAACPNPRSGKAPAGSTQTPQQTEAKGKEALGFPSSALCTPLSPPETAAATGSVPIFLQAQRGPGL